MIEYPPCKYCGASHGMGIEDMTTGEITPIDVCNTCLWDFSEKSPLLSEWRGAARYMTLDGQNVNMAEELQHIEDKILRDLINYSPSKLIEIENENPEDM